ncbi:hypothetical protein SAMN04488490_0982 [Marinobacter sp. LV10R510-11A]|nr:hypothetical protein SAMN04488490_0982 [Marinobacter sp. LV10R510-11A]
MPELAEPREGVRIPVGKLIRKVTRGLRVDYLGIKTPSVISSGYRKAEQINATSITDSHTTAPGSQL